MQGFARARRAIRRWKKAMWCVTFVTYCHCLYRRRVPLSESEKRCIKDHYDQMCGVSSPHDVAVLLSKLGHCCTEEDATDYLKSIHYTRGAIIKYGQMLRIMQRVKQQHAERAKVSDVREVFAALGGNLDGTGYISAESIRKMVGQLLLPIPLHEFLRMDGLSENISYSEFTSLLQGLTPATSALGASVLGAAEPIILSHAPQPAALHLSPTASHEVAAAPNLSFPTNNVSFTLDHVDIASSEEEGDISRSFGMTSPLTKSPTLEKQRTRIISLQTHKSHRPSRQVVTPLQRTMSLRRELENMKFPRPSPLFKESHTASSTAGLLPQNAAKQTAGGEQPANDAVVAHIFPKLVTNDKYSIAEVLGIIDEQDRLAKRGWKRGQRKPASSISFAGCTALPRLGACQTSGSVSPASGKSGRGKQSLLPSQRLLEKKEKNGEVLSRRRAFRTPATLRCVKDLYRDVKPTALEALAKSPTFALSVQEQQLRKQILQSRTADRLSEHHGFVYTGIPQLAQTALQLLDFYSEHRSPPK